MPSTFDSRKADAARDEAIDAVDAAADTAWKAQALNAARTAASKREEFTTDAVHHCLEKVGVGDPPEPRVWGAVMRKAVAAGICVKTDRVVNSVRVECHSRPIPVYRSLIYKK